MASLAPFGINIVIVEPGAFHADWQVLAAPTFVAPL